MSKAFIDAAASYFGIDPARLADGALVSNAEGLTVTFKVKLKDEDIIGVGKRMEQLAQPHEGGWSGLPSAADVVRDQMRAKAKSAPDIVLGPNARERLQRQVDTAQLLACGGSYCDTDEGRGVVMTPAAQDRMQDALGISAQTLLAFGGVEAEPVARRPV